MKVCCIVFVCSNQGVFYLVIFDHISDMRCFEVYIYNDYSWLILCRFYVEMLVLIIWCWRHLRVWSIISSANVWQISMSRRWVAFTVQCYFRWDQEPLRRHFLKQNLKQWRKLSPLSFFVAQVQNLALILPGTSSSEKFFSHPLAA